MKLKLVTLNQYSVFFFVKPEKPMKAELTFKDKQSHLWIICAYHNPGMIEENKVT